MQHFSLIGMVLVAATDPGAFVSRDGEAWTRLSDGLPIAPGDESRSHDALPGPRLETSRSP